MSAALPRYFISFSSQLENVECLVVVGPPPVPGREDLDPRQPIYQPERQALIKNICDIEGGRLGVGGLIIEFMSVGKTQTFCPCRGDGLQCGGGRDWRSPHQGGRGLYDW